MIKEGALEKFQGIFGLHVAPELPTGTIGSRPGPMLAGSMRFLAVIKGKGGHDTMPQTTRDPVLAASFAILALQQIVSRETDPLEARVKIVPDFSTHAILYICFICELICQFKRYKNLLSQLHLVLSRSRDLSY